MTQISKTQFTLIQGILAHPNEAPSLPELNEMNSSLEQTEIQEHLQQLIDANIVEQTDRDTASRYRLTDNGRNELSGTGLIDAEATLKHYYQNTSSAHDVNADRISDLRNILNETKIRLLQQILASHTGALSAVELAARNTITESTIRDHLRELADRDNPIVTTLDAENDNPVPNGIPRKYYAVTEYGIDLLKQVGLYDQTGILYDMYEAANLRLPDAADRPVSIEDIEEYEHRPSPDWL